MISATLFVALMTQGRPQPHAAFVSTSVAVDADDPAIWVNRKNPAASLILGTDKGEDGKGGLYVFDLNGRPVQVIRGMFRPNNVDIQTGFRAGKERWDIAVVTERQKRRLRIFRIAASGRLLEVSGNTAVLKGAQGDRGLPMGIALYRHPRTGETDAIIAPKGGPAEGYLARYRLRFHRGKVDVVSETRFGEFSGTGEIEAVTVDDARRLAFYSDEQLAVRAYSLDSHKPVAMIGRTGFPADREGLALRGSLLFVSDQRKLADGGSWIRIFSSSFTRKPAFQELGAVWTNADDTDGLDLTEQNLGPKFPNGILVVMNSKDRNFLGYDLGQFPR